GDCDSSGAVTIGEAIASVTNALDGCAPDHCPIDLSASQDVVCIFRGRFNPKCGGEIEARIIARYGQIITRFDISGKTLAQKYQATYPPLDSVYVRADPLLPDETVLLGWFTKSDGRDLIRMYGVMSLTDGEELVIDPYDDDPSFTLNGCRFARFA